MKTLVVEDDFTSRLLLQTILKAYGECHVAADGTEALAAFLEAERTEQPYQLICLDIMMPDLDGKEVLRSIRAIEEASGRAPMTWSHIVMTTAVSDPGTVVETFGSMCSAYLVKPIEKAKLLDCLRQLKLIDAH
jgi:two-component system chemotaxis response regulator CheY